MRILAIDPGPERSAWVMVTDGRLATACIEDNEAIEGWLLPKANECPQDYDAVVIEMIASYGMPVGAEVFETCVWIGRFMRAAYRLNVVRLKRKEIVTHLCGSSRAKDSNVRQALIDRYGPGKEKAIGTKNARGPLYGIKGDQWSALAVAVVYADKCAGVAES